MRNRWPVIILPISDMPATTDAGVKVTFKATGKSAWLPREAIDFLPGRVIMPIWLFKKMHKRKSSGTIQS